jgi:hypothetical protein
MKTNNPSTQLIHGSHLKTEYLSSFANNAKVRTVLACVLVLVGLMGSGSSVHAALANEVWISPIGPVATVETNSYTSGIIGTPTYPLRCPDAGSFYWVMTQDLTNTYMTIHFMAGKFTLPAFPNSGYTASILLKQGWKLRGAGIDNTVLQLGATNLASTETYMLWGAPLITTAEGGEEVSDLTVDCNMQNQTSAECISAIGLYGNNTRISRVKAINWGATSSAECFVLWCQGSLGADATNCVIDDCVVTQPAAVPPGVAGVTAIAVLSCPPNESYVHGGTVRNNLVYNINVGSSTGMVAYVNAYLAQAGVDLTHNRAFNLTGPLGLAQAIYGGSTGLSNSIVQENICENVGVGMYFSSIGMTNQIIKNNIIRVATGGTGIYYQGQGTNNPVQDLVLEGNIVVPFDGGTNVSAVYFDVSAATATVMNNVFQGNGTGWDLNVNSSSALYWGYPGKTIHWNTWVNNVNLSGSQLSCGAGVDYCLPGDEDSVTFTPTTAGWYQITQINDYGAATVQVETGIWGSPLEVTDTEFWYRTAGYYSTNTPGELVESRRGSYYYPLSGQVTQARICGTCAGGAWVDIYVPSTTGAYPFKVTSKGPNRLQMINPPILDTNTPCTTVSLSL